MARYINRDPSRPCVHCMSGLLPGAPPVWAPEKDQYTPGEGARDCLYCEGTGYSTKQGPQDWVGGVYVVSKIKHMQMWRSLRSSIPIISSWIDDGPEKPLDFAEAWPRYLAEAARAKVLIVYTEPGEILKGGILEIGAGLAGGAEVLLVGGIPDALVSACQHRNVHRHLSVPDACWRARVLCGLRHG